MSLVKLENFQLNNHLNSHNNEVHACRTSLSEAVENYDKLTRVHSEVLRERDTLVEEIAGLR